MSLILKLNFLVFECHPLDQREVLFLEAESGKIIEETFDSLIKSELAVHSLKQLKSKNLREGDHYNRPSFSCPCLFQVIGKKYMKKVDCIILKFSKEIDAADELFETKCDDPPVEESLPPISGSIYWSQGIGQFQSNSKTSFRHPLSQVLN